MVQIVLATRNRKKIEEIKALLKDLPVEILSLEDFPEIPELPETGITFEENATAKARQVALVTGKLTLADDSGLEIEALGGKPGIYSSRFAGEDATDLEKIEKVLNLMKDMPKEKRRARFHCVIAIADSQGKVDIAKGVCQGFISEQPQGKFGFGYDPIFFLPRYNKTMAQLPPEMKNKISHRAKALRKAKEIIARKFKNK